MKELIRELRAEHAVILTKIDEIERAIAAGDLRDIGPYVEFFETYVEQRHHAKEEGELFERMRQDPSLSEVVGTLIEEHNEARRIVEQLRSGADANALLTRYVDNLRWHIAKENGMIFDSAEASLSR